jgi:cytochrome c oxidase cbb3-type subunit I/II
MSITPAAANDVPQTEDQLVRAHGYAALAMVVYSALLGTVVSLKFHMPDFLGEVSWLTSGRLRYDHVQGIFFGWLGNAFLVYLYYAVPRLAGRPVTSRKLGWALFVVWNFLVVIPGWALVMAGYSQPLEWAEFPIVVDVFVVLAFVLMAVQFVGPFLRSRLSELYVSAWYIIGSIIFTLLAYPVGNFVPELVPGARGATYSGLWIHDAVGLYVTPFAVSMAYFVIPVATGRPIYSHFLSMLAFWMLFFIYPLNGTHHYIFSSIPMAAQTGAIVASVYLGMDVILNVTNQLLSLRGSSSVVANDVALRYTWVGVVVYLVVSLQGSFQALMPVNRLVHFSDWVIGHSHLAMIGFASFASIGGMLHVWKRTPGARYNARAANWSFWLLAVGLALMVSDLTAAGLLQGEFWQSNAPWMESVRASQWFWTARSVAAVPILAAFLALALSMMTGPVGELAQQPVPANAPQQSEEAIEEFREHNAGRGLAWLKNAYVLTAVAGVAFFLFSFVVLAVWPNQELEQRVLATRPIDLVPLTQSELRGRAIYGREGCINCHSQLVRYTEADVRRFGLPTQAWETDREYPQLWSTRRVGPDLGREFGRKSRDWQLTHLWNPRHVVPDSNMPPFPWLFDSSPGKPTQEALDLVAYLDSLGRDAQLAGRGPEANARQTDLSLEQLCGLGYSSAVSLTRGSGPLFAPPSDDAEKAGAARRGAGVFTHNCSGCHGSSGEGNGPAAPSLLPAPRNLTLARFSDRRLSHVLWFGVPGSSMPGWNDLPSSDLQALVAYVQSLESLGASDEPVTLAEAESTRARALYVKNCVMCHGSDGKGDGPAARTLLPTPTSFQQVRPGQAHAEEVLARGVPGTAMPPWKDKLSEPERRLLAQYVRTLYRLQVAPEE